MAATFLYHTLTVQDNQPGYFHLMVDALPPDIALKFVEFRDKKKIHVGMSKLTVCTRYGYKWQCFFGHKGFVLQIVPTGGGEMTVRQVKRMERQFLSRQARRGTRITLMPHTADRQVETDMIWNLNKRKRWWKGIK